MIFVDRNKMPVPDVLSDASTRAITERAAAIAHFSGSKAGEPFSFTVYRDPEVKEALVLLFEGKCAYCESRIVHITPGDIEHFRPKSEIQEAAQPRPGYYWLASCWDNLLLSCTHCNRSYTHRLQEEKEKKATGKMNQFPLSDESKRVRFPDHPNGTGDEEPYRLLLDPCVDRPEEHFEYDHETGVIKPVKRRGIRSSRGETSIRVYVLQRVLLVQERERKLVEIHAQLQRIREEILRYNKHPDEGDRVLRRELRRLKKFTHADEEYAGMARQIIGEFLRINFEIELAP